MDWQAIAAGHDHTVGLKTDGTLWAWGRNYEGQLGDGTMVGHKAAPAQVGHESNWIQVSTGQSHTVAVKSNMSLWAWGKNNLGQLGDGTTVNKGSPVQIGTDTDWAEIAAGRGGNTAALKENGTLWIWGDNEFGQLGDGTTDDRTSPVEMGNGTDWDLVAIGRNHTLALKSNGTLWTWGDNYYGQLGIGLKTYTTSPVMVFVVGAVSFLLETPSNGQAFAGCSYYDLPTFSWYAAETFKSFEIQFSSDQGFASPVRVKCAGTLTEIQMKASTWKKIMSMPGGGGGAVYWKVIGIKADKTTATSEVRSIIIESSEAVGNPNISSASKSSLPSLSWENNCNKKFKAWFGNDGSFTKKKVLSFTVSNPWDSEGEFERQLTSSQWTSIRKLVSDASGSTIYWKVESWDGVNRRAVTDVVSFVLTD
jgi:hypothetical protein